MRSTRAAGSRAGGVVAVEVWSREEGEAGHVVPAASIPLDEPADRLVELSDDAEIVVGGRGPFGVLAPEAIKQLHQAGCSAGRLQLAFPERRRAGLPIDSPPVADRRSER